MYLNSGTIQAHELQAEQLVRSFPVSQRRIPAEKLEDPSTVRSELEKSWMRPTTEADGSTTKALELSVWIGPHPLSSNYPGLKSHHKFMTLTFAGQYHLRLAAADDPPADAALRRQRAPARRVKRPEHCRPTPRGGGGGGGVPGDDLRSLDRRHQRNQPSEASPPPIDEAREGIRSLTSPQHF